MEALIAGSGKTVRELLRQISQTWELTLVDINEKNIARLKDAPRVNKCIIGDASSRVILNKAQIANHDFVLAVTNVDEVNLEVCRYAKECEVPNIISLVNDSLNLPSFQEINVRTICAGHLIARNIELFLESPKLFVMTIADGAGEVMEVKVIRNAPAVGRSIADINPQDWLIAAIHREGILIIPTGKTVIQAGDTLTIVGRTDLYRSISHFFSLGEHYFPLEYGQQVLLPVADDFSDLDKVLEETIYLITNTKAQGLTVICTDTKNEHISYIKSRVEGVVPFSLKKTEESLEAGLIQLTKSESIGCIVLQPKPLGLLTRLLGIPTMIALCHRLACPVLVSRQSMPFLRILVPCSGTRSTGLALETSVDLAKQYAECQVDVITVADPLVQTGKDSKEWLQEALNQAREIGQLHHYPVGEIVREGNTIKEILEVAKEYDLLVIGSTTQSASILKPHIGEILVQDAPCSVLVVT